MWFVCNKPPKRGAPMAGTTIRLGTTEAVWQSAVYRGQQCVAARFDADDPMLAAQLAGFPGHVLAKPEEITVPRPAAERVSVSVGSGAVAFASSIGRVQRLDELGAASAVKPTGIGLVAELLLLAYSRGWELPDAVGAGSNDEPGEAGGRSAVSGLTLSELTLTVPPVDWPELRASGRPPWESSSWVPPGTDWVRPGWRDPIPKAPEVADPTIGSPILPETTLVSDESPPLDEVDDNKTPPPVALEPGTDPAVAAGYPAEAVVQARTLALDWHAKLDDDKTPHPSALNYYLNKAGLPKCAPSSKAVAQMAGLLASL